MVSVKMIQWFDEHWYRVTVIKEDGTETYDYIPSVTTKLNAYPKPFLARWRGDVGNREADARVRESSSKGTRIHYCDTLLVNGGTVIYNPFERPNYTPEAIAELRGSTDREVFILQDQDEMYQVWKFQRWMELLKPEVVGADLTVYSLTTRDAGTVDFVFKIAEGVYSVAGAKPLHIPGGIYIVDLKSGAALYEEAKLQVSAYRKCYNEYREPGEQVCGALILHTNAKTKGGIKGLTTELLTAEELDSDYEVYRHVTAVWEHEHKGDLPDIFEFPALIQLKKPEVK